MQQRESVSVPASSSWSSKCRWQVVAFRSVRDGDLGLLQRVCAEQPQLPHERFTSELKDWELEQESLKWYQFRDSTCLFLAAAYGRWEVVEWLLDLQGVDEDEACYMRLSPIDVVGDCLDDTSNKGVPRQLAQIRTALKRPKRVPKAPSTPTVVSCKLCREEISVIEYVEVASDDPRLPPSKQAKRSTDVKLRVQTEVQWYSPWLRPGIEYELKFRECKVDGRSDQKWTTEKTHASKRRLTGLLPGTCYAVEARARNSVGQGPSSCACILQTPDNTSTRQLEKQQQLAPAPLEELIAIH